MKGVWVGVILYLLLLGLATALASISNTTLLCGAGVAGLCGYWKWGRKHGA